MSRERTFLDPGVIIDAALCLIETDGFERMRTRQIASLLGVSVMTLYNYFDNRDAILKAAILRGFSLLKEGFPEKIHPYLHDSDKNPLQLFKVVADHLLQFGLSRPRLFEFLFQADLQPHQNDPRVAEVYGYSYGFVRERIRDPSREDEIHRKVYVYEVLMGGLVRNVIKGRGNMTPERYRILMSETYDSLLRPLEYLVQAGGTKR